MTLQDHVIKGSPEFVEGHSSLNVTNLLGLVVIGIVVVEMFLIYHVASCDHVFRRFCNCGWKLLIVSYHLAKLVDHRPGCSRDITDLIFHVTLQDHVIKELCEFMEGSSSLHIPTLPSLAATRIMIVDI